MSHFTVLVVGDDYDEQLAPFHEFECTGINEYLSEDDITEDMRFDYDSNTISKIKDSEGNLFDTDDPRFWRPATEDEIATIKNNPLGHREINYQSHYGEGETTYTVQDIPEGYEKVDVPCKDVMTFPQFLNYWNGTNGVLFGDEPDTEGDHKYGYFTVNEAGDVVSVIRRTNHNAHWDWYQVGGRWRGFFLAKEGAEVTLGEPGVFEMLSGPRDRAGHGDSLKKRDIDFDMMRHEASVKANESFDLLEKHLSKFDFSGFRTWASIRDDLDAGKIEDIDKAREIYSAQEPVKAIRSKEFIDDAGWWDDAIESYLGGRQAYHDRRVADTAIPFAVVMNGEWHESASMGWWGMTSDEKDVDQWAQFVNNIYDTVDDDTLLTIVDCHI